MRLFDPHIHMTSRTTDDYQAMAAAGHRRHRRAGLLGGPAAQPRRHVRGLLPVAARLGAVPGRSSSGSATSAPWRSTPRRPTTRRSPTGCSRCCAGTWRRTAWWRWARLATTIRPRPRTAYFRRAARAGARVRAAHPDPHPAPGQEARHRADAGAGQGDGLPARADPGRPQQRGDAAADARVGLLGRPLDLPAHQDGRGAHGDAGEEVRHRADHREQRRRLGGERSAEGAQDRGGPARGGRRRGGHRADRAGTTRCASSPRAGGWTWRTPRRQGRPARSCGRATRCCAGSSPRVDCSSSPAMRQTLVLDVVGLTPKLLPHAPALSALAARGGDAAAAHHHPGGHLLGAVDVHHRACCPRGHGCVANGWYFRDLPRWRCGGSRTTWSTGEKIWDAAKKRDPAFTCAKLFWWYNMYSSADFVGDAAAAVPGRRAQAARRLHRAAGRPARRAAASGWAPSRCSTSGVRAPTSSAASGSPGPASTCSRPAQPTLTLVYLPHLDYDLQRLRARTIPKVAEAARPWTPPARRCSRRPSGPARRWWCCRSTASPR